MKPLHSPADYEFRDKRLKANLSQSEAAEILSVHVNSVKNWEHGRACCSPATWAYFCSEIEERQQNLRKAVERLSRKVE